MKKILFIIAGEGYQPIEYGIPKKILLDAGMSVVTASNVEGKATASDNSTTQVDIVLADVIVAEYDGIFIVGGPGAMTFLDYGETYRIVREAKDAGIYYGAICISPRILAHAGVLKGKKVTGWDGDEKLAGIFDSVNAVYIRTSSYRRKASYCTRAHGCRSIWYGNS